MNPGNPRLRVLCVFGTRPEAIFSNRSAVQCRGFYDLQGLRWDIVYNARAGADILKGRNIDALFFDKYREIKRGRELALMDCYRG